MRTLPAGHLAARRLTAAGIDTVFTLSGGHLFPLYDGLRAAGIRLIDTRHEQTAAFAAEGWAKVTRRPGVVAVTAGPGVTNAMSALAAAQQNQSPLLVLAGRAPAARWGMGSLQEFDPVPVVAPLARFAATAAAPQQVAGLIDAALQASVAAPSGVGFVDVPLDHLLGEAAETDGPGALSDPPAPAIGPDAGVQRALEVLATARRPVIVAGTNVWWGHAEAALRVLAESRRIPVLANGMARGMLPADHELAFSRARALALRQADVVVLVGAPMDFRLGFGAVFGPDTAVIAVDRVAPSSPYPRDVAAGVYGDLTAALTTLADPPTGPAAGADWLATLRIAEKTARRMEGTELADDRAPLHPMRVYAELVPLLDRDAIIVVDGGDFGSYAGRMIDSYVPGAWLDAGPFGCLGSGPGYALAAKLAHPDRQVVLLQGDGAFGFSGLEWDTLIRHDVAVVAVIGNNGVWGLEKHPMEQLYGYSVVAELRAGTRYERVVSALGGRGELVAEPTQLRPALQQAFRRGVPAVINVLTDPTVAYPRRTPPA
ncbi:acetolactate synthase [Mycolicibacillus parakoreensis]|uniref:acetolactate synthase n=1 Tax=Mycolicibacillus parakoreensis TaxID=1069221 RepID=A0ABY3U465_9MYCO|nr:acetolactate synthase [Mycolicibacillus parakoreensis]MCV7317562.1 acetolactate synthase [Mycolicibacillus parakoreensis]ULN54273.1 acetolactate synthase [Mycolicibacillus parakoreensis]HLR98048.1 acetolactate synthase [Mycolicibacillus parakoreensis]